MKYPPWDDSVSRLAAFDTVPAALANADLLRRAQARWDASVIARTSMHDLLFTLPGEPYPFDQEVRVSHSDGTFEFKFNRGGC